MNITLTRFAETPDGVPLAERADYIRLDDNPKSVSLPGHQGRWFLLTYVGNIHPPLDITGFGGDVPPGHAHWTPLARPLPSGYQEIQETRYDKLVAGRVAARAARRKGGTQ